MICLFIVLYANRVWRGNCWKLPNNTDYKPAPNGFYCKRAMKILLRNPCMKKMVGKKWLIIFTSCLYLRNKLPILFAKGINSSSNNISSKLNHGKRKELVGEEIKNVLTVSLAPTC